MTLTDLYSLADRNNVSVECYKMNGAEAFSVMEGGRCFVAIDPYRLHSEVDEKIKLAHDLGHCFTGAFYNRYSPLNNVRQQEHRANAWAIKKLVPEDELKEVLRCGYYGLCEIAEYFEVSEDFARKACEYYFCA